MTGKIENRMRKNLELKKYQLYLHSHLGPVAAFAESSKRFREHSSAGSEHLPYKQRAGGSNPSAPTDQMKRQPSERMVFLFQKCLQTCLQGHLGKEK